MMRYVLVYNVFGQNQHQQIHNRISMHVRKFKRQIGTYGHWILVKDKQLFRQFSYGERVIREKNKDKQLRNH